MSQAIWEGATEQLTYSEAREHLDAICGGIEDERLPDLDRQQSIVLHQQYVAATTDVVRIAIQEGTYAQHRLDEVYYEMQQIHARNPRVGAFDAAFQEGSATMEDFMYRQMIIFNDRKGLMPTLSEIGPEGYRVPRTTELADPIRYSQEFGFGIIGVPTNMVNTLLPRDGYPYGKHGPIHMDVFRKAQQCLDTYGYDGYLKRTDITDAQRQIGNPAFVCTSEQTAISIGLATILDMLHIYLDLNGRTSEDWMIEYQRRMAGDMDHIVTWSESNLRGKGLDELPPSELEKLPSELLSEYYERERLLHERGQAILRFKAAIITETLYRIREDGDAPGFIHDLIAIQENPQLCRPEDRDAYQKQLVSLIFGYSFQDHFRRVLSDVIRGIDQREVRLQYGLETEEGTKPPGVINVLMNARRGHSYAYKHANTDALEAHPIIE